MSNLDVTVDQNSGFCFGVVYAIELAEAMLDEQGYLYSLGDIVHNDEEVRRLREKGLITIQQDQLWNIENDKVLIRAHGEPPETYEIAKRNNIELIDASCPVVLKLQNRIRNSYDKDEPVYIYGKPGHAEIIGLKGQTNNDAVVFQSIDELDIEQMPSTITLYSQTTKNPKDFWSIKETLEAKGITVNAHDSICRQVSNRDQGLIDFAGTYDKVVFVAGKKSSNGKVLYELCREVNPNTYFVSAKEEIDNNWFEEGETIGVCGATSTPQWLMEEVKSNIENL